MNTKVADFLPLTPTKFQILTSMARAPQHGWALRREVAERTGGAVQLGAGTLYTAIQRLERDGLIVETACPADLEAEAGPRWRFYRATDLGRAVLEAEIERMEEAVSTARAYLGTV